MKWIEERDALIAQTKAFVEQVTRRSADIGRTSVRPVPRDAVVAKSAPPLASAPPPKVNDRINDKPSDKVYITTRREALSEPAATQASALLAQKFDQVSMSSEIRTRIAAFRAHQERFNRERHEYFNATLARLRAEIDELPPPAQGSVRRPDTAPPTPAAGVQPAGRRPEGRT
jgi:hypothetical protein